MTSANYLSVRLRLSSGINSLPSPLLCTWLLRTSAKSLRRRALETPRRLKLSYQDDYTGIYNIIKQIFSVKVVDSLVSLPLSGCTVRCTYWDMDGRGQWSNGLFFLKNFYLRMLLVKKSRHCNEFWFDVFNKPSELDYSCSSCKRIYACTRICHAQRRKQKIGTRKGRDLFKPSL